jgi:hypothetical protein
MLKLFDPVSAQLEVRKLSRCRGFECHARVLESVGVDPLNSALVTVLALLPGVELQSLSSFVVVGAVSAQTVDTCSNAIAVELSCALETTGISNRG